MFPSLDIISQTLDDVTNKKLIKKPSGYKNLILILMNNTESPTFNENLISDKNLNTSHITHFSEL